MGSDSKDLAYQLILQSRRNGEGIIAAARLILCGILFLMVVFVLFYGIISKGDDVMTGLTNPAFISEMLCIILSIIISLWVFKMVKQKKYYNWMGYVFSFFDITFLNIIIYFNAIDNRALVFTGAPTFIYIVFLVLATLRNSVTSVIFTGVYISISYGLLTFFHAIIPLHIIREGGNSFGSSAGAWIYIMLDDEILKPVIFLMITGLLAFIAHRVKKIYIKQTILQVEKEETGRTFTENLLDVTRKVLQSSTVLTSSLELFTTNVEILLGNSRNIKEELNEAFTVMEETVATITEMIHSNITVANSVMNQSHLIEDGVTAIQQIKRSVGSIIETSTKADQIAKNLCNTAQDGENTIEEVVNAIGETKQASKKIEEIVEIISGLAQTTDLLAMNAAIEAAHAGEAGKGFAVVADEIRQLAENSGENTKGISSVLEDILHKIDTIAGFSGNAQEKLMSIVKDAEKTSGINSEVLRAMEEESAGMQLIVTSLKNLVSITDEIKGASSEQSVGGKEILTSLGTLKSQADSVTGLVIKQVEECNKIEKNTSELNSILENNKEIIKKLGNLVKQI